MGVFGKPESAQDVEYMDLSITVPTRNQHKIKAMIIEHYMAELKDGKDRTEALIKNIIAYGKEKNLGLEGVSREEKEEGVNDVLRCYKIKTYGTVQYKLIKQCHIDNYVGMPSDEEVITF